MSTAIRDQDMCWRCRRYATVRARSYSRATGDLVESELLCDDHAATLRGGTYAPNSAVNVTIEKLS